MPAVDLWAELFTQRFNVFTRNVYKEHVAQIREQYLAPRLKNHALRFAITNGLPPFQVACGFFTFGLVWANLLPHESLIRANHFAQHASGPILCLEPPEKRNVELLVHLQRATSCNFAAITEICSFLIHTYEDGFVHQ